MTIEPKLCNTPNTTDALPVEMLGEIAAVSTEAYRAMCLVKQFAAGLSADTITNWQIHFGHSVEITARTITWMLHGKPHRIDGPAVIYESGTKKWFKNGLSHRVGAPSIIYINGSLRWHHDGKLHRDDGPAMIFPDGDEYWYLHGEAKQPW